MAMIRREGQPQREDSTASSVESDGNKETAEEFVA